LCNYCTHLFWWGISVKFKLFWVVRKGKGHIFAMAPFKSSNAFWCTLSQCQGTFLVFFALLTLIWPHSPTREVSGSSNYCAFPMISVVPDHPKKSTEVFNSRWPWWWKNCRCLFWVWFQTTCCSDIP
jgi:hypothetical protein